MDFLIKAKIISVSIIIYALLPVAFFAWLPFLLYRVVIQVLAKLFRRDLIQIFAFGDALVCTDNIHECPRNGVVACMVLEEVVDPALVRRMVKKNILHKIDDDGKKMYPEMGRTIKFWLGFPFWKKAIMLNGEEGVKVHDKSELTMQELHILQSELVFQPFLENYPLWEIVIVTRVINNEGIPTGSGVFLRFHHGLMDGYGVWLLIKETMIHPEVEVVAESPFGVEAGRYAPKSKLSYLRIPYELAEESYGRKDVGSLVVDKAKWNEDDMKSVSDSIARLRFHSGKDIALSKIKKMGTKFGVSGTAVLHSAVLGALRSSLFDECEEGAICPRKILIQIPLPIPMGGRGCRNLGNHLTVGSYLGNLADTDPVTRLIETNRSLQSLKESGLPLFYGVLVKVLGSFPLPFMKRLMRNDGAKLNMVFITSLPGPNKPINFCGHVITWMNLVQGNFIGSSALLVSLISKDDKLTMGVLGDRNVLQNFKQPQYVTNNFIKEIEELARICELDATQFGVSEIE